MLTLEIQLRKFNNHHKINAQDETAILLRFVLSCRVLLITPKTERKKKKKKATTSAKCQKVVSERHEFPK